MLEKIRLMLMNRLVEQGKIVATSTGILCPNIQNKLEKLKAKSASFIPHWNGKDKFEVVGMHGDQFVVNVTDRTCSCQLWDITGIPCKHVTPSQFRPPLQSSFGSGIGRSAVSSGPPPPAQIPVGPVHRAPRPPSQIPVGPLPRARRPPGQIPVGPVPRAPRPPAHIPVAPASRAPRPPSHIPVVRLSPTTTSSSMGFCSSSTISAQRAAVPVLRGPSPTTSSMGVYSSSSISTTVNVASQVQQPRGARLSKVELRRIRNHIGN
ncbi:hypothetical protein MRB53_023831 [Persea americana]|uniref:Uncharacterized protein n=1 Tax=Persea americana TaxID=3435 RepID=A0ACC2LBQ2_PERAE|nr:hypothetical protein MRB53_023831 [Persea americana]